MVPRHGICRTHPSYKCSKSGMIVSMNSNSADHSKDYMRGSVSRNADGQDCVAPASLLEARATRFDVNN